MSEIQHEYRSPQLLAENIWEVTGEWTNSLGRRMTIVRLNDQRIFIHNAFKLKKLEIDWLREIGKVSFIVAPNVFHCSDAGWMAKQFPDAELFVPQKKIKQFAQQGFHPKDVNADFPSGLSAELVCVPMRGSSMQEAAFIHAPSGTLILCDLSFNMPPVFTGLEKIFMTWNKVGARFGPSRLTKILFAKDSKALMKSYQELLTYNFDRIIVNHGDILEVDGKNKLRHGVEDIFGPL